MSNKKKDDGFIKVDDKGVEQSWYLSDSERRREALFDEMASGNFSCTLKEIFAYVGHLKKRTPILRRCSISAYPNFERG